MGEASGNPDDVVVVDMGNGHPGFIVLIFWKKDKETGDPPMVEIRKVELHELSYTADQYDAELIRLEAKTPIFRMK